MSTTVNPRCQYYVQEVQYMLRPSAAMLIKPKLVVPKGHPVIRFIPVATELQAILTHTKMLPVSHRRLEQQNPRIGVHN